MGTLIEEFLEGSKRVTAKVYYFIPLHEGEQPRKLPTQIIGGKPNTLHHAGILQEFTYQQDDRADVGDAFKEVFTKVMNMSGGIVKIHDRSQRIAVMNEATQLEAQKNLAGGGAIAAVSGVSVPQIFIPKRHEETTAGMEEIAQTFKMMVPFPRLRSFLQYWQDNVAGPLHHVQFVTGNMTAGYHSRYEIN